MRMLRFTVPVDDRRHEFTFSGEIKHVGTKVISAVELWVLEGDPTVFAPARSRTFQVFGTGNEVPDGGWAYVGTTVVGGALVWHLFERVTP